MSAPSALADPAPSRTGRPRGWLVVVSLALVLVCGVVTWVALRDDRYTAPPPAAPQERAAAGAAARTLDDLALAVSAGDAGAAGGLAPPGNAEASRLLRDLASNARDLRIEDFSLRYVDEAGAVSASGAWTAAVDASWQLAGVDLRPTSTEILVGLVTTQDGVAVSSLGGGDLRTPVWMTGRVSVRRTRETLVIDRAGDPDRISRLAKAAIPVVRRMLPGWRTDLVVEVPESAAALDRTLAAEPGQYAGVAAVTTGIDGSPGRRTPVHVFVNPQVFADLGRVGAQVVMSHEATHIATGASASGLPLWLLEGFADYVALRDVDLPLSRTAAQIVAEVRRDGAPEALPGPAEFDTIRARLGASYEGAWLACVVVAEAGGERDLVALYRAVDDGQAINAALRRLVGFGEAALVRRWQQRLSDLAA